MISQKNENIITSKENEFNQQILLGTGLGTVIIFNMLRLAQFQSSIKTGVCPTILYLTLWGSRVYTQFMAIQMGKTMITQTIDSRWIESVGTFHCWNQ